MKSQALQLKLHHTLHLVISILLTTLVSISGKLFAEPSQEIRLFHEPMTNVEAKQPLSNLNQSPVKLSDFWQPKTQRDFQKTTDKSPGTEIPSVDNVSKVRKREKKLAFQYNGFIASASGRHYLINGLPLSGIDSLILVSVKQGGRSIILKTPKGQSFELSVGQSVSEDSL